MEDIYATHLFDIIVDGDYIDRENHYLYKEYYNDDLSHESEVHDYGSPCPYITYFEVAYVYKFNKVTQKMECIFNRNDKIWKTNLKHAKFLSSTVEIKKHFPTCPITRRCLLALSKHIQHYFYQAIAIRHEKGSTSGIACEAFSQLYLL